MDIWEVFTITVRYNPEGQTDEQEQDRLTTTNVIERKLANLLNQYQGEDGLIFELIDGEGQNLL